MLQLSNEVRCVDEAEDSNNKQHCFRANHQVILLLVNVNGWLEAEQSNSVISNLQQNVRTYKVNLMAK